MEGKISLNMMRSSPYISIYSDENHFSFLHDDIKTATLIFSKHLPYNPKLRRTRVNIDIGPEEGIHALGSIKSVSIKCNPDIFRDKNKKERLALLLKIIYEGMIVIAKNQSWDLSSIANAYKCSLEDDQELVWYSKLTSNQKRTTKARIRLKVEEDQSVSVVAEFFENAHFLFDVHLIDTFLVQAEWFNTFSKPLWLDNEHFGFSLQGGQVVIAANTIDKQTTITSKATSLTSEELEWHIRMITFRKFSSKEEMRNWMNGY